VTVTCEPESEPDKKKNYSGNGVRNWFGIDNANAEEDADSDGMVRYGIVSYRIE